MKNPLMRWAWNQPLSPLEKLVLLALAEAADENGVSSPSISVLAIQCQLSSRTVQRAINALLNVGLLERTRRQRDDGASISSQYRLKVQGDDSWSGALGEQVRGGSPSHQMGSDQQVTPGTTDTALPHPSQGLGASDSHTPTRQRSDIDGLLHHLLVRLTAAIEQGNIQAMLLELLRGLIEQAHVDPLMQASEASNQRRIESRENAPVAPAATGISRAFASDPLPNAVAGDHHREIQASPQTDSSKVTSTTNSNEPPASTHADGTLRRRPLFPELARVIG